MEYLIFVISIVFLHVFSEVSTTEAITTTLSASWETLTVSNWADQTSTATVTLADNSFAIIAATKTAEALNIDATTSSLIVSGATKAGCGTCNENAQCVTSTNGVESCVCYSGYLGDGYTCSDYNECNSSYPPCSWTNGVCQNTFGSFLCSCKTGWVLDVNNSSCIGSYRALSTWSTWSAWSDWSVCSASCLTTSAIQSRSRICEGDTLGGGCVGQSYESSPCTYILPCPGNLTDWSQWSACSSTCKTISDGPYQYRNRSCVGYSTWNIQDLPCNGSNITDQQYCNQNVPCLGNYSAWSNWSICSASCQLMSQDFPIQFRSRICEGDTLGGGCLGPSNESIPCNNNISCPGNLTDWSQWSTCSSTCKTISVGPYQYRNRSCVGYSTWNVKDVPCNGSNISDQQFCNQNIPCLGNYSAWSDWSVCSASCRITYQELPFQSRRRICEGDTLGGGCVGESYESGPCNYNTPCPGNLTDWSQWSACSSTCKTISDGPYQYRNRSCVDYSTWNIQDLPCNGSNITDQQFCNQNIPCLGNYSAWSNWSICSASCQLTSQDFPIQFRSRICEGDTLGGGCLGPSNESIPCNNNISCPGNLTDWSQWSTCSSTCKTISVGPYQYRNRSCVGYSTWNVKDVPCNGSNISDQQFCNQNIPCLGNYSAWSDWSICSASCRITNQEFPFQSRRRICEGDTLGGGCIGESYESGPCNYNTPCPGDLTDWSQWSACSSTCKTISDGPYQYRNRSCVGYSTWNIQDLPCNGSNITDQQFCNQIIPCLGNYSAWSNWSICSASCQLTSQDFPMQFRSRICEGDTLGGGCLGPSNESIPCNNNISCPGNLTDWSQWSACSSTCKTISDGPYQFRNRSCVGYSTWNIQDLPCNGSNITDQQFCNQIIPCLGNYSAWSDWSICSASCQLTSQDFPIQSRSRICEGDTLGGGCLGPSNESRPCNNNISCPGNLTDWSQWSTCSSTCKTISVGPYQYRKRSCVGYSTWNVRDVPCNGNNTSDQQLCNQNVPCLGNYSAWSDWSICSASCQLTSQDFPIQSRSRICEGDTLGGGCLGPSNESRPCNNNISCPGNLTDWSQWGACSSTCKIAGNGPYQYRNRSCVGYSTWNATYVGCNGSNTSDQQLCNQIIPCLGNYSAWSDWSSCSASCQFNSSVSPFQSHSRICQGDTLGGGCVGPSYETKQCSFGILCPGNLTDWGQWSACSDSCNTIGDGPYQYRNRSCIGYSTWDAKYIGCNGSNTSDQQLCNQIIPCLGNYSAWSDWSSCSATCQINSNVSPFRTHSRVCEGDTLDGGCIGSSNETQPCNSRVSCPGVLSSWNTWGVCSQSCHQSYDLPMQSRSRLCEASSFGGNCNGSILIQTRTCNIFVNCPGFSCATANFFISGSQWTDQLSNKSSVEYKELLNQLLSQFEKNFTSEKFTNELYFQDVQFYRNTNIGVIVRFTYKAQMGNTIENCEKLINFKLGSNLLGVSIKPCDCCINQTVGQENLRGVYTFPFTIVNNILTTMCAYNSSITFQTQCLINNVTYLPELVFASLNSCPLYSPTTYQLINTANLNVTIANILNVTKELNSIIQNGNLTSNFDIKLISTILRNIISVNSSSENVTNGVLSSINSLLSSNSSLIQSANQIYNSSTEFLVLLDVLGKQQSNNVSISLKNLGLTSYSIKPNGNPVYVYSTEYNDKVGVNISSDDFDDELEEFNNYIVLPSQLFMGENKVQVYSYIYKESSFFTEVNKTIESLILSASLNGIDVKDSSSLIDIKFSKLSGVSETEKSGSVTCSFYKVKEKTWSSDGCNIVRMSSMEIICQCNHLTNFAKILNVYQSNEESLGLEVVTWIGCGLSIAGLVLTIVSYSAFPSLRQKLAPKILIILCTNLLCTLVLFLALVSKTEPRGLCQTVASLLQFFILSTFFWMAIEGFNLYKMFVKVFGGSSDSNKFLLKASAFGWGIPLIFTIATAVSKPDYLGPGPGTISEKDSKLCVVRGFSFYFGILLPVCIVMAFNIVILLLTIRGIDSNASLQNKMKSIKKVRIAFACSLLLGTTWLFAILAVGKLKVAFQWLFCIFNSLQGFFIFLFYTLDNKKVKEQWVSFLYEKCGWRSKSFEITNVKQINTDSGNSTLTLQMNTL
nr:SCO-spondin-like isoform X3 [Hydra vulgaris]